MSLAARVPKPKVYRGWWVVSAPFLAAALGTGAGQYGFGVFIEPLQDSFGWSRSQISAALSFTAAGSLMAPFFGRVIDRYGSRPIMAASLAVIMVSYLLRPFMTELWHWYALSLIQYTGYTAASMLPAGKLVGIWFQRTRGRVMGITAMGNNFGGLIMPPLMGAILLVASWEGTFVVLGVLSAVLVLYTLVTVRDFPTRAELGDQVLEDSGDGSEVVITGWTVGEALRSRAFYAITLAVVLGTFTYAAILPQIITHLTDQGVSLAVATLALSVFAICGMVGKFVMGNLADRITSRYTMMINFCGQAAFLVMMIWAGSPMIMWISIPLFGFFNGAFGALFSLVVQDAFGIRYYGSIMGIINLTTMVSFGIGPILAGASYDVTGSYQFVFVTVAIMFLIGAASLSQGKAAQPRSTAPAAAD